MASISFRSYCKADSVFWADVTLTVTQSTQSVTDNTTKINYSVSGKQRDPAEYTFIGTTRNPAGKVVLKINGSTVKTLNIGLLSNGQGTCSASGSVTVPHNADGTKTLSYSVEMQEVTGNFSGDTWKYGATSKSGSMTLTTIPRASSFSITNDNMVLNGSNVLTVNISRASSSFTHSVKFDFGTHSHTLTGQGTSASYTIPLSWIDYFGNGGSGTKTGTITVTTYNGNTVIGSAVSKTFTLTCPSASSISSATSSIECNGSNAIEVNISRSVPSFTHTVKWGFGTYEHSKTGIGTSTSYAPPASWTNMIPNTYSGTGAVYVTTFYGNQQIGATVQKDFTLTIPDYTPTVSSVGVSLVQDAQISDWNIYLEKYSKVKFVFNNALGNWGSSINKYTVELDGVTYTSTTNTITSNVLQTSGTLTYKATVYDTRNKPKTISGTIDVQAFVTPKYISSSIYRYDGTAENDEGTQLYFNFNFSWESYGGLNSTTNEIYIKQDIASSYAQYGTFENNVVKVINDYSFDINKAYNVRVVVTDELGSQITLDKDILTAKGLIDADGANNSIGLLKMASRANFVQIGGGLETDGSVYVGKTSGGDGKSGVVLSNGGGVEIFHDSTPFLDFHHENSTEDYTSRIVETEKGKLKIYDNLEVSNTLNARSVLSDGYTTENTSNTKNGYWYKVGTLNITSRYEDTSAIFEIMSHGDSSSNFEHGYIHVRAKQQDAMGEAPYYSCMLSAESNMSPSSIWFGQTVASETLTEIQLWCKIDAPYRSHQIKLYGKKGNATINTNPTLQESLPYADRSVNASYKGANILTGFTNRNNEITWGTLKPTNGYSYITRLDTADSGSVAFADKDGQTNMQVDGFFYQREGNTRVADLEDLIASPLLWSGAVYMNASQTANLSQAISAQKNGVILIWSSYTSGTANNYEWNYVFVSKRHISNHDGTGVCCTLSNTNDSSFKGVTKYVYVYDNKITGHARNQNLGGDFVLRYVYGF